MMKSLILLGLSSLPLTLSLAIDARLTNSTLPTATTGLTSNSGVLPPPSQITQADVASNCARWDKIGFPGPFQCTDFMALYPDATFAELTLWNPSVGPKCDNMWGLYWFCSAISGPYVPPPAQTPAGIPIKPPGVPMGSTTTATCDRWDTIIPGASCQTFMSRYPGLTLENLQTWNPAIDLPTNSCFLQMSFELCTSIVGYKFPALALPPPPTTPQPAPGSTQAGVTADCKVWDVVGQWDSCAGYMAEYDVTLQELVSWNPAIGADCTNLWVAFAVCVGA